MTEIARPFTVSLNAISKHLIVLERAVLIERDVRGREHFCRDSKLPCPMCNMWADGYDAVAAHVGDKVNFVLVSKVQIDRLREWGRRRGWNKTRLLSSHQDTFNRDFLVEDDDGQRPGVSVFKRGQDGKIYHFYTTEVILQPGHHRGIDPFSPVWNLFDLLPEGREMWMPKHFY